MNVQMNEAVSRRRVDLRRGVFHIPVFHNWPVDVETYMTVIRRGLNLRRPSCAVKRCRSSAAGEG